MTARGQRRNLNPATSMMYLQSGSEFGGTFNGFRSSDNLATGSLIKSFTKMSSKDDLRNFQLQLDQVNDGLSLAPDDQELLDLKAELTDLIELLKEQLQAEEAEAQQEANKPKKWQQKPHFQSPSKPSSNTASPAISSGEHTDSPEPPSTAREKPEHVIFKVGDVVSAKWASGDGGYYPAKITAVTGSSSLPYYTVQFIKWSDTMETLPAYHTRVLADDKKRKVTAAGFDKPPPPKKIDPQAKEAAQEKKLRRLREKQELERTKQNWQNFAAHGPKKRAGIGKAAPIGSNSMFKTPDSNTGRGMISLFLLH